MFPPNFKMHHLGGKKKVAAKQKVTFISSPNSLITLRFCQMTLLRDIFLSDPHRLQKNLTTYRLACPTGYFKSMQFRFTCNSHPPPPKKKASTCLSIIRYKELCKNNLKKRQTRILKKDTKRISHIVEATHNQQADVFQWGEKHTSENAHT